MLTATAMLQIKRDFVLITPARAKAWLDTNNTHNRNRSDTRVAAIARDIREGRWVLSNTSIAFLEDGTLGDGQHRLAAIALAGVPVHAWVECGWPMGTRFDDVRKRSFSDNLFIAGEKNTVLLAATSDLLLRYACGYRRDKPTLTQTELAQSLAAFPSVRESIHFLSPAPGRLRVTAVTAAHALMTLGKPRKAEEFFDKLVNGEGLSKGDPVLALRNRILGADDWGKFTRSKDWQLFNLVVRSWNATIRGERVTHARIGEIETAVGILGFAPADAAKRLASSTQSLAA